MPKVQERPLHELGEYIRIHAKQYRVGPEVTVKDHVTEIYAMPSADTAGEPLIDVGFFKVQPVLTEGTKEGFLNLLKKSLAEQGEYQRITPEAFLNGPSYITTGGWIGDQGLALCLYALIEHFGLGKVITPAVMHMEGAQAQQMLGMGFVMIAPSEELRDFLLPEVVE